MCARYTLTKSGEEVAEAFGLDEAPELEPRYNVAPSQPVLAVVKPDVDGPRRHAFLRWGLKSAPEDKPLINARAETAATRGAFREAFARRRCLVPADGFYEWQGPKGAKNRQPFHLRLQDGGLFGLAGLFEPGLEGAPGTLTLLTTAPNELVETIHDRMPVIVPSADYARWLDPKAELAALRSLLGPFPAARMAAFPVGPTVNDARVDDPACLTRTFEQGRLV
jgi:putative SOS response-associated peptidase YedK